jgi:hypothetical protein
MDLAAQVFMNQPVPGESLTVKSGSYPYENPPLVTSPVQAFEYVMDVYDSGNNEDILMQFISAGVTLEYLSNVIVQAGFINGIYTVDVAEIIKPAVLLQLLADARDAGIQGIRIVDDAQVNEFSSTDYMELRNTLRGPEPMMEETPMEVVEQPMPEGSFLDMETT